MSDLTRRLHQAGTAVTNDYLAGLQPTAPQPHAARREAFARAIYEHWNPRLRWEDAHPDDRIVYGSDADVAMKAADATAGISYALPLRADVYQELAVRLDYYTETKEAQQAGLTAIGGVVREWATHLAPDQLPSQQSHLATILRELADEQTQLAVTDDLERNRSQAAARRELVRELRRLADAASRPGRAGGETQQAEGGDRDWGDLEDIACRERAMAQDIVTALSRRAAASDGQRPPADASQPDGKARRPRCPHCQMPHDLTPGNLPVASCESTRRRIADAERLHEQGDHHLCCRADCEVLRARDAGEPT
ncbi:hypothetical protein [Streptomyces sp. NPDC002692]